MRRALMLICMLSAVGLDCTVIPKIAVFSVYPSLSLCMIATFGAINGAPSGIWCGLLAGVLLDVLFSPVRGFYAIINTAMGYLSSIVYEHSMRDDAIAFGIFSAGMYIFREILTAIFARLLGVRISHVFMLFVQKVLPASLFTGIVGVLVFLLMRWAFSTLFMRRGKSMGIE